MNCSYNKLFKNLCCSRCKSEFSEKSFTVISQHDDLKVVKLVCENCGKDFGTVFLRFAENKIIEPLIVQDGPEPINCDEVIDAHNFIKNLDENWKDYLPELE